MTVAYMRNSLHLVSTSAMGACAVVLATATPVAQAAVSVGYWFEFTQGSGPHDQVLTPDAISNAALQGLRAGGISAIPNPSNVDAMLEVDVTESFEPEFQSLRIVSGVFSLKAPRPGAANFERPILLCQSGLQTWRTSQNSQDAARKVRDAVVQQAAQFAKRCRAELNNL